MSKECLVEWILNGKKFTEDDFKKFYSDVERMQENTNSLFSSIDSFLKNVKKTEKIDEDAKKISDETIQSIGMVLNKLSEISSYASIAQDMCKIDENMAVYAKPLGMLVGQIKDALDHGGALIDQQKVLGKFSDRWYDINVTGLMLKNLMEK